MREREREMGYHSGPKLSVSAVMFSSSLRLKGSADIIKRYKRIYIKN